MKKVMIHCSTNDGSSNFGDVLFAKMILDYLGKKGFEAAFYDLSPYFEEYLYKKQGFPRHQFNLKDADAALYFGGGYFGERECETLYQHIHHYQRFMRYGKKALKLNKKIAVIGIGAGNYLWGPSKTVVKNVCEKSLYVTTRDQESTDFLKKIGVSSDIKTCSDIVQTLNLESLSITEKTQLDEKKKYIFVHTSYKTDVAQMFAEGLEPFLQNHPDVDVIIGTDSVLDIEKPAGYIRDLLGHNRTIVYNYTTPDNLCWILSQCSLVVTYKLHVGIVSAALSKSVIAFPKHEKVKRYYQQIGESDRFKDFKSASPQDVLKMAECYWEKNIVLNDQISELAKRNWDVLDEFLKKV